jgi:hypothetical protein
MIEDALSLAKADLGVAAEGSWTAAHYQLANRLAFLWYLRRPARHPGRG